MQAFEAILPKTLAPLKPQTGVSMYKNLGQFSISDMAFPFGKLKEDNRWVILAGIIPWEEIEGDYAAAFVNNGAPAHPARMALGALIAKQMLKCSDADLVEQVAENPYLQFFLGLKEFSDSCPFGASTLVAFRKRFTEEDMKKINEIIIKASKVRSEASSRDDDGSGEHGSGVTGDKGGASNADDGSEEVTLALDATVVPSDITYPQDIKLLDSARKKLEDMVNWCCMQSGATGVARPRMYKNRARKDFLAWSKAKRPGAKKTRKALRKQLGYVARDIGYVHGMCTKYALMLPKRMETDFLVIETLYAQQKFMYDNKTHSVKDRIVSIPQPWVRPIVRGKAHANTEFGAKVHASIDGDGMARIENMSFDVFNESEYLIKAAEAFCMRKGRYPDRILADDIYRTRANIAWCKEHGIRLSGKRLGRPTKDTELSKAQKAIERKDAADRNSIEGLFGTVKRAYGLNRVAAKLEETTMTVIAVAVLVFNLRKIMVAAYVSAASSYFAVLRLLALAMDAMRLHLSRYMVLCEPEIGFSNRRVSGCLKAAVAYCAVGKL
jgi:hypothetical protein